MVRSNITRLLKHCREVVEQRGDSGQLRVGSNAMRLLRQEGKRNQKSLTLWAYTDAGAR